MTDREVMRQALEALEAGPGVDPIFAGEVETALRVRLAEPEPEPEPVAWYRDDWKYGRALLSPGNFHDGKPEAGSGWIPLYTAPPTRRPLTDEEIDSITRDKWGDMLFSDVMEVHREFARAIERKITGGNDE